MVEQQDPSRTTPVQAGEEHSGARWKVEYDKAEAARLAREGSSSFRGVMTYTYDRTGERRPRRPRTSLHHSVRPQLTPGEKKKPVTRSDTRKATEEASAAQQQQQQQQHLLAEEGEPSSPEPFPEGKWNPKTQGYDGYYNWRLGK